MDARAHPRSLTCIFLSRPWKILCALSLIFSTVFIAAFSGGYFTGKDSVATKTNEEFQGQTHRGMRCRQSSRDLANLLEESLLDLLYSLRFTLVILLQRIKCIMTVKVTSLRRFAAAFRSRSSCKSAALWWTVAW